MEPKQRQAKVELLKFLRHARDNQEQDAPYEAAIAAAWICLVMDIITQSTYNRIDDLLYGYRYPRRRLLKIQKNHGTETETTN